MPLTDVASAFSALGGRFATPPERLAERAAGCRGILFDWDGVFNAGIKSEDGASPFSEADSMGVNLLRFALWRKHGRLPIAAVITGEHNPAAKRFAARERFDVVYSGVKNKGAALERLCTDFRLRPEELVMTFDDVNDLPIARRVAVRVLVDRSASPLFKEYVVQRGLVDYVTAARAGEDAVREAAELLLGLTGSFDAVVDLRAAWDPEYVRYFDARQAVETRFESVP